MTSSLVICARAAGLDGFTSVTSRPPAGGDSLPTAMPMNASARAPSLARASSTARRGVGERKSTVTPLTVPFTGRPPRADGKSTVTSPWKVVCTALSPLPQKRD